ncbi:MAG: hypothetical protein AAFQ45_06760 [Pseudomonadota bacterium]
MRLVLVSLVAAAALGVSSAAWAFQTEDGAKVKPGDAATLSDGGAAKTDEDGKGTVIQIPGLGKLGVIPKLDFGLELLYDQDPAKQLNNAEPPVDDDGMRIRGTIKHRF